MSGILHDSRLRGAATVSARVVAFVDSANDFENSHIHDLLQLLLDLTHHTAQGDWKAAVKTCDADYDSK
jgi:hypothetical protein